MRDPKLYADCYQTMIQIFFRTKMIPKSYRPTLGRKMEETSLHCLLSVRKALYMNSTSHKQHHLYEASQAVDELKVLFQIAKDLNILSVNGFSELTHSLKEIGKQMGGLLKYGKRLNTEKDESFDK